MIEAGQYRMLFDAQVVRDSLVSAYEHRIMVLEDDRRTNIDHLGLMERKATEQEADLVKLRSQLSSQKSAGNVLTTLGVVVGAATAYILVRKR